MGCYNAPGYQPFRARKGQLSQHAFMTNDNQEQRETFRRQGLMLMNSGRLDEAKALFTDFSNQYPDDADPRLQC